MKSRRFTKSPYLKDPNRLGEVIAAIQATAIYEIYQLQFGGAHGWAWRIRGRASEAANVRRVFEEHPEFFRIDDDGNGSLVWRRQLEKLYDVDKGEEISKSEVLSLSPADKAKYSRSPLEPEQVAVLINAAIELHSSALENAQEHRWWVTAVTGLVSSFGGALIGVLLSS